MEWVRQQGFQTLKIGIFQIFKVNSDNQIADIKQKYWYTDKASVNQVLCLGTKRKIWWDNTASKSVIKISKGPGNLVNNGLLILTAIKMAQFTITRRIVNGMESALLGLTVLVEIVIWFELKKRPGIDCKDWFVVYLFLLPFYLFLRNVSLSSNYAAWWSSVCVLRHWSV